MADQNDEALTARLVLEETPQASDGDVRSYRLRWYHYIEGVVLILLTLSAVVVSAFSSIWTALFVALTLAILLLSYRSFIYPYKPTTVTTPFLITHAIFGVVFSRIAIGIISTVLSIALGTLFLILAVIFFSVLLVVNPDGGHVLFDDLESLSNNMSNLIFVTNDTGGLSRLANMSGLEARSNFNETAAMETLAVGVGKIYSDFVQAFGIAALICIGILLFAFILFVLVSKFVAFEHVKWALYRRYQSVSPRGANASVRVLGISGLVFFACTGAFMVAFGTVLISVIEFRTRGFSLFSAVIDVTWALIGTATLVGSQILVAVAHAEVVVLRKRSTMWLAVCKSISFNLLVFVLTLFISSLDETNPDHSEVSASSVITFVVITVVQVFIVYRVVSSFLVRVNSALAEESALM